MQTCAVSLSQDPVQLYFSWKKCNTNPSPRNNHLHVKTNTIICPRRFQKTIKGQDAPDFFGRGRNCQQSFSGFKVDATLEGQKLQISSRKIGEKNYQGLCHLEVSV